MSDTHYTPKWERKPAPNTTPNVGTTDTQRIGDAAPLGYCPFSKYLVVVHVRCSMQTFGAAASWQPWK